MLYRIERITDRTGRDREDGRNPQRIGREGALLEAEVGYPMQLAYIAPDVGTLVTSRVNHIKAVWPRIGGQDPEQHLSSPRSRRRERIKRAASRGPNL